MGLAVNCVAAALLALTIGFYVFVYTIWLKRRTPQNIVIGGAAGAFPPLIGWAAVTGDVGWPALALFALIFFWTPPHFWALSLYRAGDYAKRRRADAAGGRGRARDQEADAALYARAVAAGAGAGAAGRRRLGLRRRGARALGAVHAAGVAASWREPGDGAAPGRCSASRSSISSCCSLLMALDRAPGLVSGLAPVSAHDGDRR